MHSQILQRRRFASVALAALRHPPVQRPCQPPVASPGTTSFDFRGRKAHRTIRRISGATSTRSKSAIAAQLSIYAHKTTFSRLPNTAFSVSFFFSWKIRFLQETKTEFLPFAIENQIVGYVHSEWVVRLPSFQIAESIRTEFEIFTFIFFVYKKILQIFSAFEEVLECVWFHSSRWGCDLAFVAEDSRGQDWSTRGSSQELRGEADSRYPKWGTTLQCSSCQIMWFGNLLWSVF